MKTTRRIVLATVLALNIAAVAVGLYWLTNLTTQAVMFLTTVVGLLQLPIVFYFRDR